VARDQLVCFQEQSSRTKRLEWRSARGSEHEVRDEARRLPSTSSAACAIGHEEHGAVGGLEDHEAILARRAGLEEDRSDLEVRHRADLVPGAQRPQRDRNTGTRHPTPTLSTDAGTMLPVTPAPAPPFSRDDLEEALRALASTIAKCEKVMPKLRPGTSQHTLLTRRLKALRIASTLIQRELDAP